MKNTIVAKSLILLCTLAAGINSQKLEFKQTFRAKDNQKNIGYAATIGGSSHYNWILQIGNELCERGHNFTFITTDSDARFGLPFNKINTVSSGPGLEIPNDVAVAIMSIRAQNTNEFLKQVGSISYLLADRFIPDYTFLYSYFQENKFDLVICDFPTDACADAANMIGIPIIISNVNDVTRESAASYVNIMVTDMLDPSTEFLSFSRRFHDMFIAPFKGVYYLWNTIQKMSEIKSSLGITSIDGMPDFKYKNNLKLVNSLFGFTIPRPVGSLTEMVGPILNQNYDPLTPELEEFLDAHDRVAYIAFGQFAKPVEKDIVRVLLVVLESIEQGHLDGFIWAAVDSTLNRFPVTVKTSKSIYNIKEMIEGTVSNVRVLTWAPQTAILFHSSTRLFVSHGGVGSWYESVYAGKPMALLPFYSDQPSNALTIERAGLGSILRNSETQAELVEKVRQIVTDEDGSIKDSLDRYQAIVQIHHRNGVQRGADVVEEVAYTLKDGKLPHREPASRRMSFVKAHNMDLYAAFVFVLAVFGGTTIVVSKLVISSIFYRDIPLSHESLTNKAKKLQ